MNKHIPDDPWIVEHWYTESDGTEYFNVDGPKYGYDGSFMVKEEADLVSAAPEMLVALKFARPFMAVANQDSSQDILTPIDNAIKKAEGKSSAKQ